MPVAGQSDAAARAADLAAVDAVLLAARDKRLVGLEGGTLRPVALAVAGMPEQGDKGHAASAVMVVYSKL